VQYYVDGGRYDGNWEEDLRSGVGNLVLIFVGTYYYPNGKVYEGKWVNDQMSEPSKPIIQDKIEGVKENKKDKEEIEESVVEDKMEQVIEEENAKERIEEVVLVEEVKNNGYGKINNA
jgi:hypothetical protein